MNVVRLVVNAVGAGSRSLVRALRKRVLVLALASIATLGHGLAAPAQVAAQGETPELDAAARALFEDGRRAFDAGDFATALSRFQQAYDVSHRAPLLWNIATTLDRLRRDREALAAFEQYLVAAPETPQRAEVEGRIRVLREAVAAEDAEAAAREAEAARLAEERERLERERDERERAPATTDSSGGGITPVVFIVGAGLTAVAAGVLIWSGVDTLTANDNYVLYAGSAGAEVGRAESLFNEASAAQLRTNVLIGVTGALGAATLVLAIFTDWDGDPAPTEAGPAAASITPILTVSPDGAFAGLGGSF